MITAKKPSILLEFEVMVQGSEKQDIHATSR